MINKQKNIFIIANCSWYIYNFRLEFIEELHNRGYKIILICNKDKYNKYLSRFIFRFESLFLIRGSENPLIEFITIIRILFLYLKYKPYLVHNFTIKPCIYGSLIARILNCKIIINHITGLGPSLLSSRLKIKILNKILNPIYRFSFNNKNIVNIFHNSSDRDTFIQRNLTVLDNTFIIKGSGVDIKYFYQKKLNEKFNNKIHILFPARIIKQKGIIELLKACKELWSQNYQFTLNIVGEIDKHNKSSLKESNINELFNNSNIKFLGKSDNMLEVYKNTDIVVLPSWREGLSKALLESAAMSLPIITTDVPGCRDVIKNNYSGILVPLKDIKKLKSAIKNLIDNPKLAKQYGKNARKVIEKDFEVSYINNKILNIYHEYLNN